MSDDSLAKPKGAVEVSCSFRVSGVRRSDGSHAVRLDFENDDGETLILYYSAEEADALASDLLAATKAVRRASRSPSEEN